jgi:signal peptidase I
MQLGRINRSKPERIKMQNCALAYIAPIIVFTILVCSCSPMKTYKVPSVGMEPTILADEEILVDLDAYRSVSVQSGDVVTFQNPKDESVVLVKRCVATGGQSVFIRQGVVFVDNKPFMPALETKRTNPQILAPDVNDPKIFPPGAGNRDNYGPITVPSGKCFLLGDHRDNSLDSRYFGFVDEKAITGKVLSISKSSDGSRVGERVL